MLAGINEIPDVTIIRRNGMEHPQLDWNNLGFSYRKTDIRYISYWRDGEWHEGDLTEDNQLHISEGSTALHYG
ncbi:Branched-chain amino acid aminotransferase, partial [Pseudomonas savastanoi pv. glycinea]